MSSRLDLAGIKTEIKNVLDGANSAGASPVDLSNSMNDRVQKVFTKNPNLLFHIQSSQYPWVTIWTEDKSNFQDTMSRTQLGAKRVCDVSINIAGAVYEDNILNADLDEAQDQIEELMENVEYILRSNDTFNGKVLHHSPQALSYGELPMSEDAHLRLGVLTIQCKVHY